MNTDDAFGRVLAIQRAAQRMSRKELAVAAELSYPYMAEIENGIKRPRLVALDRIAAALGTTTLRLLTQASTLAEGGTVEIMRPL